jgi:uncharacterized membrane protein
MLPALIGVALYLAGVCWLILEWHKAPVRDDWEQNGN